MLSKIPIRLEQVKEENLDREILRMGIIAELDAINLYEQMAAMTKNAHLKAILLDIAKEEKAHVGEFQALLLQQDADQVKEMEEGKGPRTGRGLGPCGRGEGPFGRGRRMRRRSRAWSGPGVAEE